MCVSMAAVDGGRSPPLYRFAWNKGSRVSRVLEEDEKCEKVDDVDVEINTCGARNDEDERTDTKTSKGQTDITDGRSSNGYIR